MEDLISIGTIGLIKAVNTFKTDKNIKLATYASRCIENEILMFLRKSTQYRNEISIDEPLNIDWDGNELCPIFLVQMKMLLARAWNQKRKGVCFVKLLILLADVKNK